MTTRVHALTLGERIAYPFTLTAGTQDTNARFRISNITLDCERLSFEGVDSDVNTIHICRITSGSIGDSLGSFVAEGQTENQPDGIPGNYARIAFNYFNPSQRSAEFITLEPGNYLLVPSAGYGPAMDVTGLVAIGNGVTQPRKFRFQTFATTSATRTKVVSGDNNMTVTFGSDTGITVIEQRRNSITGVVERTSSEVSSYIPIFTMGIRKVFRGRENTGDNEGNDVDINIIVNTGADNYPEKRDVENYSTSMNTFKGTYGSHGIDYIYTTVGGKHMIGTQKQFVMLNGKIHVDTDTSFVQSSDLAFELAPGSDTVRTAKHVRDNTEYTLFIDNQGYGVMYNGVGDPELTEESTNIESLIVPFGFKGHNFIAGWDGNVMGIKDNCLSFIHRTGWYTEQNLQGSTGLEFSQVNLDFSGIISTDSLVLATNTLEAGGARRHAYVHDTSLYTDDMGFTSDPSAVSFVNPTGVSAEFLNCRTTVVASSAITNPSDLSSNTLVLNNHVVLLTPSLNFVDTVLDICGHFNTEVQYGNAYTSQQWVMSNAYAETYPNTFGYTSLRNSYDNYDLGTLQVNDEIEAPDNETNNNTDITYVIFSPEEYVRQNYILDTTTDFAKHTIGSYEETGQRTFNIETYTEDTKYGITFDAARDAVINTVKVFMDYDFYQQNANVSEWYATIEENDVPLADDMFTFQRAIFDDQAQGDGFYQYANEIVLYSNADIPLTSGNKYTIVLSPALALLSEFIESPSAVSNPSSFDTATIIQDGTITTNEFNIYNDPIQLVYDRFAEDLDFNLHGDVYNVRNARNITDGGHSPLRNITIKAPIVSPSETEQSYIDLSFNNLFSAFQLGYTPTHTETEFNYINTVTICGETQGEAWEYDGTINKFRTQAVSTTAYADIVPIQIEYVRSDDHASRLGIEAVMPYHFELAYHTTQIDGNYVGSLEVPDIVAVLNMIMTWHGVEAATLDKLVWTKPTGTFTPATNDVTGLFYQINQTNGAARIAYTSITDPGTVSVEGFYIADSVPAATQGLTIQGLDIVYVEETYVFINISDITVLAGMYALLSHLLTMYDMYLEDGTTEYQISGFQRGSGIIINTTADPGALKITGTVDLTIRGLSGGSPIANARETHFFTTELCTVTDDVLTFKPLDNYYVYDLFTRNMTGNILTWLKYEDADTVVPEKYLVKECWFEDDGSNSYNYAMRLMKIGDGNEEHTILEGLDDYDDRYYFYLQAPAATDIAIAGTDYLYLTGTQSHDILSGFNKLSVSVPDFNTPDITFTADTATSQIRNGTPMFNMEQFLRPYEKSYVSNLRGIINATNTTEQIPLLTVGYDAPAQDPYHNAFDPATSRESIFNSYDSFRQYGIRIGDEALYNQFTGDTLTLTVTVDATTLAFGPNKIGIRLWTEYPHYVGKYTSLQAWEAGTVNTILDYGSRARYHKSQAHITCYQDGTALPDMKFTAGLDPFYIIGFDEALMHWTEIVPFTGTATFEFVITGPLSIPLIQTSFLDGASAALLPVSNYKENTNDTEQPMLIGGLEHIPQVEIVMLTDGF